VTSELNTTTNESYISYHQAKQGAFGVNPVPLGEDPAAQMASHHAPSFMAAIDARAEKMVKKRASAP
jgi:hypothetical protein